MYLSESMVKKTKRSLSISALSNEVNETFQVKAPPVGCFWCLDPDRKSVVFMKNKVRSPHTSEFCLDKVDLSVGFLSIYNIRLGAKGIIIGYLFSAPYPMRVEPSFFSIGHFSLYSSSNKVQYRNEELKPLLKLGSLLLMKYGEFGFIGMIAKPNCSLTSFLNMV